MLDFPNIPEDDEVFSDWRYNQPKGAWQRLRKLTALPANRIVNPAMQISEQYGDTGGGSAGLFIADQWVYYFLGAPLYVGAWRSSTIAPTVGGPSTNKYRLALNVVTAKPSLAAADYLNIHHSIEGNRVSDFKWGTAQAKQVVLRFVVRVATAGPYCVSIRNAAANRSWIGSYYVAQAGVDTEVVIAIPGDTTGTWLTDTGVGLTIIFPFAMGTNYYGVPGWQNGNLQVIAGTINGAATVNSGNHITDVGLYLDPYYTGRAPPFQAPLYEDDLKECQRYWCKISGGFRGLVSAATSLNVATAMLPVPMRVVPAAALAGTGLLVYDLSVTRAITNLSVTASLTTTSLLSLVITTATGLAATRPGVVFVNATDYIAASARM